MDLLGGNDDVADRIRRERERRGWTYRELADRMSAEGCTVAASTLHRMENGSGPSKARPKIGVEELVAACRVFGLTPEELLMPAELFGQRRAQNLIDSVAAAAAELWASADRLHSTFRELAQFDDADVGLYAANRIGSTVILPPDGTSAAVKLSIIPALRSLVGAAFWPERLDLLLLGADERDERQMAELRAALRRAEEDGDVETADEIGEAISARESLQWLGKQS